MRWIGKGDYFVDLREAVSVFHGQFGPLFVQFVDTAQLTESKSGRDVCHVVFVARLQDLGLGRTPLCLPVIGIHAKPMKFQSLNMLKEVLIIRAEHAPFTRGDVFYGVKGEDGATLFAYRSAQIVRTQGVGCVFNHRDPLLIGHFTDGVHMDRGPGKVHGNNQPCLGGKAFFHSIRGDHQGVLLDINKDRSGPNQYDMVHGGDPGHGRRNDFVPWSDPECLEDQVHSSRGRRKCNGSATANVPAEFLFKPGSVLSGSDPS